METCQDKHNDRTARKLTGRGVLLWLVAFFGVVFGVNAVMIRFATSTFGGVETASSYAAGLAFSQNVKAAQEQDALHWKVDGKISRKADGGVDLVVTALTQDGKIIPGWTAHARLAHPADRRLDQEIALTRSGSDRAVGEVAADAGQWDLIIELSQDNGRVFRSRNRVTLR